MRREYRIRKEDEKHYREVMDRFLTSAFDHLVKNGVDPELVHDACKVARNDMRVAYGMPTVGEVVQQEPEPIVKRRFQWIDD